MSLNKVMLIGNVGQDPEVRYLENQSKVARLRIATTENYTDRNGERRENTEWHTVTCWRRHADLVERYVKKGTQLYVEGRLQTREWTDQTGAKRFSTEITADNIQLLGRRSDNQNAAPSQSHPYVAPGQPLAPSQTQAQTQPQGYNPYGASFQSITPAPAPTVQMPQSPAASEFGGEDDDLPF